MTEDKPFCSCCMREIPEDEVYFEGPIPMTLSCVSCVQMLLIPEKELVRADSLGGKIIDFSDTERLRELLNLCND